MSHDVSTSRLTYRKIRDVSTIEEQENRAATSSAANAGLRDFEGRHRRYPSNIYSRPSRKKRSFVHKQIERTITNKPERFSQLNSGFLIGASRIVVDDNKRVVDLFDASVNNGAQSRGEIKRYFEAMAERGEEPTDFAIRVEISVEPDPAVRTDIAIARNTATRVQDISQAGARGYFRDLDSVFLRFSGISAGHVRNGLW